MSSGRRVGSVGRTLSCASCVFFALRARRRAASPLARTPRRTARADTPAPACAALSATRVESVRMYVMRPDRALGADVDALVEILRDAHRALGAERELLRRFLLQRGRRERRRRILAALAPLDLGDAERLAALEIGEDRARPRPCCAISAFLPSIWCSLAVNRWPAFSSSASMVQYSTGLKARISRSRSTMSRSATVCTRPAEIPFFTVFQSTGLAL